MQKIGLFNIVPKKRFLNEIVYNVYTDLFDKTCNVETPIDLYIDLTWELRHLNPTFCNI